MTGLLAWQLIVIATDPWVLTTDPEWLGPTRHVYAPWPGIWWLRGGIVGLAMAWFFLWDQRGRQWLWVTGCLAGSVACWLWMSGMEPPVFLG